MFVMVGTEFGAAGRSGGAAIVLAGDGERGGGVAGADLLSQVGVVLAGHRTPQRADPCFLVRGTAITRPRVLEALQIDNARAQGWSWRDIARVLGVTKEAVYYKHARRVRQSRESGAS